ncbi:MAG: hypothetical protein M1837_004551 [Sclerophora amabilis]|nr:MAG: hypothetical protein M1837_004551 [Sclerophora amabilis]
MPSSVATILPVLFGALILILAVVLTWLSCVSPRSLVPRGYWVSKARPPAADEEKGADGGGEAPPAEAPAEGEPAAEGAAPAETDEAAPGGDGGDGDAADAGGDGDGAGDGDGDGGGGDAGGDDGGGDGEGEDTGGDSG